MMKKWLLVLCFPLSALAANVSLDFRNVGVVELSEGVIKGMLQRDYVIAPEVLGNASKLTMSVKSIDKAQLVPMLTGILAGANIALEDRQGVIYLTAKKDAPQVAQPQPLMTPMGIQQGQGFMYPGQQSQFQGMPPVAPKELSFHRPRGKSVEFLSAIARIGGAYVPDLKGKGDVVVFGGDPDVVERVKKLLQEVDVALPSLHVRAALLEFTESDTSARSFSLALSALSGKLGIAYQAGQALNNSISLKGASLQGALSAIDGDQRFRYIAEPSLLVADGEEATFTVGSEVPVRAGAVVDKGGNPVQSIEYRTAGILINVKPKVLQDSILLKVGQQISSFALTTTSGIDSPTILKRQAETTINAQEGELVVIAGMDESRESDTRSGLSFLPSWLYSKNSERSRSQMLLLLEVKKQNPI